MNTMKFENNCCNIPARSVSGCSVVSICIAIANIIFIISSVIIIAPPGMA